MRKDIEIHIDTGDIAIKSRHAVKLYPFSWVPNEKGLVRYIYGEIQLPSNISESSIINNGIYITIPYSPKYNEFYLRIKRVFGDGVDSYIQNPVDGSEWFLVRAGLYGQTMKNIYASQLVEISDDNFYIKLNKGFADIYSGHNSDVNIVNANDQNKNMLLKCVPSNSYRYPTSGVGLIRWLNSNIDYTKLSYVLQKEFAADETPVESAKFDLESQKLYLDLDTSLVDGNI